MKAIKLGLVICTVMIISSIKVIAGIPIDYTIEYSPSNPVAGQPVTFTLTGNNGCGTRSLVPDAANNIGDLVEFPGTMPNTVMHTYPSAGIYHVALDLNFDECLRNRIIKTNRDLTESFQMGPVGGPYAQAILQVQGQTTIFCSPITIAAGAPIPTMGQWSIIILFILTSILGVVFIFNTSMIKLSK